MFMFGDRFCLFSFTDNDDTDDDKDVTMCAFIVLMSQLIKCLLLY